MKHWPDVSQPLSLLFLCVIVWTLFRILLPEYTAIHAVPMRMAILFVGAQICGVVLRAMQLPEMLGMLGFGVFFTNMGWGDFTPYQSLESFFRYGRTHAYTIHIFNSFSLQILQKWFGSGEHYAISWTGHRIESICSSMECCGTSHYHSNDWRSGRHHIDSEMDVRFPVALGNTAWVRSKNAQPIPGKWETK